MATKSRPKGPVRTNRSTAKVVSNKKAGASWLNQKWAGPLAALAVIVVGAITLVWTQAATTTHTLFGSSTPKNSNINDSRGVELGVKFRAQYSGQVTGVRFYKSSQNTGTHIGNLWTKDGTLLARATFSKESKSGWQQVTFAKPVDISANTTYIASYYAPKGHFGRDTGVFKQDVKSGPLVGLRSGSDGNNGVYKYGSATTFPASVSQAQSNYWVDVVYTTSRFNPTVKPNPPTGLSTAVNSVNGANTVTLTWKPSTSTNLGEYRVIRDGTVIASVAATINTYTDTKVVASSMYTYSVVAVDKNSVASDTSNSMKVTIGKNTTPVPTPAPTPTPTSSSPQGKALYVDPRLANDGRPAAISGQPYATWIGGWSGDPAAAAKKTVDAATAQGKIATLVLYNIPLRDCGLYSAGGLANFTEYKNWIAGVAAGIGQREAIVIVEPDALAGLDCLNATQRSDRVAGLTDAVTQLTSKTKAFVYIDAGNVSWIPSGEMANRLKQVGIDKARGFAVNTSNFYKISENITYGTAIAQATGGKSFVIDTSRNGAGAYVNPSDSETWCNPPGRGLGVRPTTTTGKPFVDAYLWVKTPGESDGSCKGAPAAGQWYEAYAQELIRNANYSAQ
jgi:endoglucanase